MKRNRAEAAATETSAHDGDRVFDHFICRNRLCVRGVRFPGERQIVDPIHLPFGEGRRGRKLHNRPFPMILNEGTSSIGIRMFVYKPCCPVEAIVVFGNLFK